jgi:hypothetical protein
MIGYKKRNEEKEEEEEGKDGVTYHDKSSLTFARLVQPNPKNSNISTTTAKLIFGDAAFAASVNAVLELLNGLKRQELPSLLRVTPQSKPIPLS